MRWLAVLTLIAGVAHGQWATSTPRPTPRPTYPPAPTSTPRPLATVTPRPTSPAPSATPRPTVSPAPSCPPAYAKDFVFVPGVPLSLPAVGQSLLLPNGDEFVALVPFAGVGEIEFRFVRVK